MRLRALSGNVAGAATIYVSMFIMILFIIVVLSFVHVVGRNYAETADNQLNMQAIYAAETGLADARSRMLHLIDLANRGQIADFRTIALSNYVDDIEPNLQSSYGVTALGESDAMVVDGNRRLVVSDASASASLIFEFNAGAAEWEFIRSEPSIRTDVLAIKDNCLFAGHPGSDTVRSYMDNGTGYVQQTTLLPFDDDPLNNQAFGSSLAVNDEYLVIGSPAADGSAASAAGAVYVYRYDRTTCALNTSAQFNPETPSRLELRLNSSLTGDAFASDSVNLNPLPTAANLSNYNMGVSVAINNYDIVVAGIPGDIGFSGAVAVYAVGEHPVYPQDVWYLRQYVEPGNYSYLDCADANGLDATVGSYDVNPGEEAFGHHVSINDSSLIAAGDPKRDADTGFVGVYGYGFDPATSQAVFNPVSCKVGVTAGDAFGSVALLGGSEFLAVGAPGYGSADEGQAYAYQYNSDPAVSEYAGLTDNPANWPTGTQANHRLGNSLAFGREQLFIGIPGWAQPNQTPPSTLTGGFQVVRLDYQFNQAMNSVRTLLTRAGTAYEDECINEGQPGAEAYLFRLNDDGSVNYSCLRIDMMPDLLYYEKVRSDRSLNVVLKSVKKDDPEIYENMEHLDIQWVDSGDIDTPSFDTSAYPNQELPDFNGWTADASVLRVQITAFNLGTGFTREDLQDQTKVFYLYPRLEQPPGTPPNEVDWAGIVDGDIIESPCGAAGSGFCSMAIENLPNDLDGDGVEDLQDEDGNPTTVAADARSGVAFLVNIVSLYKPSSIYMKGYNHNNPSTNPRDTGGPREGDRVKFIDIQAILRATGNAINVQARLSERVPLQPAYDRPEFAIVSANSICKIFVGDQDTFSTFTDGIPQAQLPDELRSSNINYDRSCEVW